MPISLLDERSISSNDTRSLRGTENELVSSVRQQLIGVSPWAVAAAEAVATLALGDDPIMIVGEPGTGKEYLARLIHTHSARGREPLVTVSQRGASEETIRAALFGSEQILPSRLGQPRKSLLQNARGGTLYLSGTAIFPLLSADEIDQLKRYKDFRRLAGRVMQISGVRLAIGFDPADAPNGRIEAVGQGVAGILSVPPLRQRKADIELLAKHFMKEECQQAGKEEREISAETLTILRRYDWPNNVDELRSVVEYMVLQSRPPCIDSSLIPPYVTNPSAAVGPSLASGVNLGDEVRQFEKALICEALKQCHGVQTNAAKLLRIKLSTLNTKIKHFGINVRAFKA
jgi:DNA-binding NtrC family response regulator